MTKDQRTCVVEYATQLPDEDLRMLGLRLVERLGGDLADALNTMSKCPPLDEYLLSCDTAAGVYDAADKIRDIVLRECKKRGVALKWGPPIL